MKITKQCGREVQTIILRLIALGNEGPEIRKNVLSNL